MHKLSDSDSPQEKAAKILATSSNPTSNTTKTEATKVDPLPAIPSNGVVTDTPGMKESEAVAITKPDVPSPAELEQLENEVKEVPGGMPDPAVAPRESTYLITERKSDTDEFCLQYQLGLRLSVILNC